MKNWRSPADVRNQAAGSSGVVGSVVGAGVGSVFGVDSVVVVSAGVEEPDDVVVVEPLDVADEVVEPEPEDEVVEPEPEDEVVVVPGVVGGVVGGEVGTTIGGRVVVPVGRVVVVVDASGGVVVSGSDHKPGIT